MRFCGMFSSYVIQEKDLVSKDVIKFKKNCYYLCKEKYYVVIGKFLNDPDSSRWGFEIVGWEFIDTQFDGKDKYIKQENSYGLHE